MSSLPVEDRSEARSFWERPAGRALTLLARLLVGGLFLYAALPKLLDPAEFARSIDNYHMLPPGGPELTAAILPPLEVVLALALLVGLEVRGAALITAVMLAAFCVAMGQALARGIDLSCGCFGAGSAAVSPWSILRNLALIGACALLVRAPDPRGWPLSRLLPSSFARRP